MFTKLDAAGVLTGRFLPTAHLQGARLDEADLEGAILFEANLQGARLVKVNLQGALGLTRSSSTQRSATKRRSCRIVEIHVKQ